MPPAPPHPSRPDGDDASGFGPSLPPAGGAAVASDQAGGAADDRFDLCHVGLALRTVLLVEAALALGVLHAADTLVDALSRFALASAVGTPAALLWLLTMCGVKRAIGRASPWQQWAMAGGVGAASAGLSRLLIGAAGHGLLDLGPALASLLSGAFAGVLLMAWLQLRRRGQAPADASARLSELQSRIRPHFLFNTLNSALGLVRRDPARAEALLEDLSELFRAALADDASVVSLGEEIELAQRYLAIEQVRFGDRLRVEWDLDPAAAAARLPPLLLQPLIENAVRHGIEPDPRGGVVRIHTRLGRGQALVSISNSLPPASSVSMNPGHGIALQNVRERLHLMHDVAARFDVRHGDGQYRVQMALPL